MSSNRAIAIDLGGTQVRAALFEKEHVLRRASLYTDVSGGPSGILDQFEELIDQVCKGVDINDLAGIGLSSAGPIDTEAGIVLDIPTIPGLHDFPIKTALTKRFGLPVFIENDAIAAALGEWKHGAGSGLRNMAYLTVSTGIGGGAVVDGKLLHGRMGMGTHVGHMRLAQEGPICSCGAQACFEAFASGPALAERARLASQTVDSDYLLMAAKTADLDASTVFDGARSGDQQCLSLVDEEALYLGQGITSIIHVFSPERVIMGGGLSNGFDLLEAGIHAVIQSDAMAPFKNVPVVASQLGDNAGLVGAATMVLEDPDG